MRLHCWCLVIRRVGTARHRAAPSTAQLLCNVACKITHYRMILHTAFPTFYLKSARAAPRPTRTHAQQPSTSQRTHVQDCHKAVEGRQRLGALHSVSNKAFLPRTLGCVHKLHHPATPLSPERLAQPQHRRHA